MGRIKMTIALVMAIMMVAGSVTAQDYSGAIKSLADLDSTVTAIKKQLVAQGRTPKMLVSTGDNVRVDQTDMLYSLVDNLQVMSQELQVALGDAQTVAAGQPKYPGLLKKSEQKTEISTSDFSVILANARIQLYQ